jgi:hypothetical protein
MTFFGTVDTAIDQVIKQQPSIFNLNDKAGDRSYRVLDTDAYFRDSPKCWPGPASAPGWTRPRPISR